MNIKLIPKEFKLNKLKYELINRNDKLAMYAVWGKNADTGKLTVRGYEVHKLRVYKTNPDIFKNHIGYGKVEGLAKNEDFGRYGWYYKTLKQAYLGWNKLL